MATLERSLAERNTVLRLEEARAIEASVNEDELTVRLEDGRTVVTPLEWYPRLVFGTEEERQNFRIVGRGYGVHWPELDEDLSVKGMLAGLSSGEGASSLKRWKKAMQRRRQERAEGSDPEPWGVGKYRWPYGVED